MSDEDLKAENIALRATVRKLEDRIATLGLELGRSRNEEPEATTEDRGPIATTSAPAIPGYMHTHQPAIPKPRAAGEVLPPEQRASWARKRTPHDR